MRICCCFFAMQISIAIFSNTFKKAMYLCIAYHQFPFCQMIFQGSLSYFTFFHSITVDTAVGVMIHKNYFCGRICIRVIISNELLSKSTYF